MLPRKYIVGFFFHLKIILGILEKLFHFLGYTLFLKNKGKYIIEKMTNKSHIAWLGNSENNKRD